MKDRLRKRRRSLVMPAKYRRKPRYFQVQLTELWINGERVTPAESMDLSELAKDNLVELRGNFVPTYEDPLAFLADIYDLLN